MIIERQFAPNRFQHCSTISKGPPGSGTFLAYYTGDAEMHKTQHVRIHWFSENNSEAQPIDLGDYTGNPILIETVQGTRIIYSKFEPLVPNRIEWWQHCSLWSRNLDVSWRHGKPEIVVGAPLQIVFEEDGDEEKPPAGLGYLPRCHPIWYKDGFLLPLYREHNPHHHGVVLYSKDGIDWEYRGSIGKGTRCIQPTIWYDKKADKLRSLLRRFSRAGQPYAYYSESSDGGRTWMDLHSSPYLNANNSILAINNNRNEPLIIWNNDPMGRDKISLSTFGTKNGPKPYLIAQLDGYGSYPSACIDKDTLHIVYTAKPNPLKTPGVKSVIKYKQYDLEAVLRAGRKDTTWPGFSQIYSSQHSSSSQWRAVSPKTSQKPGDPSQK